MRRDRLLEALEALGRVGPRDAEVRLVERLAGADAQDDAARVHHAERREVLRDDGRVVAEGRGEHRGADQIRDVRAPSAPSHGTDAGAWPPSCSQGCRWSETKTESKPISSARTPKSSSSFGSELLGGGLVAEPQGKAHDAPLGTPSAGVGVARVLRAVDALELRPVRAGEPFAEGLDRARPQQGETARALVDVPVAASAGHPAGGCRSLRDLVGIGALGRRGRRAARRRRRGASSTRAAYAACSSIMSTEEEWPSDAFGPFEHEQVREAGDHRRAERRHALPTSARRASCRPRPRRARRRADGSRRSRSRARARRPHDASRPPRRASSLRRRRGRDALERHGVRRHGRVEVVRQQHALAAERVVRRERGAQRRVGDLRVRDAPARRPPPRPRHRSRRTATRSAPRPRRTGRRAAPREPAASPRTGRDRRRSTRRRPAARSTPACAGTA